MGNRANGIKSEKKQEILEALDALDKQTVSPPKDKIVFLMQEYNNALEGRVQMYTEADLFCKDCRRAVVNFWRHIRTEWNKTA